MRFPIVCFDDFYTDPDQVRDYALSLPYSTEGGIYPGLRTRELSAYNDDFHYMSVHKFLSMCDDFDSPEVDISVDTFFQKIWRFSKDKDSPLNGGWIHTDNATAFAGLVYLSPDPDPDAGTTIYRRKKDAIIPEWAIKDDSGVNKSQFIDDVLASESYCPIDSIKHYEKGIVENSNQYEPTLEVKNKYNRMIGYDGDQNHCMTTCWTDDDEDFRLTQVFFIKTMRCNSMKFPNVRCERYGI